MYPSFRISKNQVQFGPFLLDEEKEKVLAFPWPAFYDPYQLWGWIPLGSAPLSDGGIWVVFDARTGGYRIIRLDEKGDLAGAITVSYSELGQTLLRPPVAYDEWIKIGKLLFHGIEENVVLDKQHYYPLDPDLQLYPCSDGKILRADGILIDLDGNRQRVFRPKEIWQMIWSEHGKYVRKKNQYAVFDKNTVWIFANGEYSEDEDVFWVMRLNIHDGSIILKSHQFIRKNGFSFWPLSHGAWAVVLDLSSSATGSVWWIHPPGFEVFGVIDISSILKEREIRSVKTRYFGLTSSGDIVALVSGIKGRNTRIVSWIGKNSPGKIFELVEQDKAVSDRSFTLYFLRWVVLKDSSGGGMAVMQPLKDTRILAEGFVTQDELIPMIYQATDDDDLNFIVQKIEKIVTFEDFFLFFIMVFREESKSYGSRLISGKIRDGKLEIISSLDLDSACLVDVELKNEGDSTVLVAKYLYEKWVIQVGQGGELSATPVVAS